MKPEDTLFHIEWGDGDNSFVIAPDKDTAIKRMDDGADMIRTVVKLDHLYQLIFKAGFSEALNTVVATREYDEGKADGIREVVEWMKKYYESRCILCSEEGKAKLKEWGIK